MRHLTAVSSDELIDSLHTRVITNTICENAINDFMTSEKISFLIHYF